VREVQVVVVWVGGVRVEWVMGEEGREGAGGVGWVRVGKEKVVKDLGVD
jgi:hypothetical protein